MTDAQLFHCPSCGGPLDLETGKPTIRCKYCSSAIIVPPSLRQGSLDVQKGERAVSFLTQLELGNLHLLIVNGRKIEAIKRLRELTDLSLKDAKDIADAMERGEQPDPIPAHRTQAAFAAGKEQLDEIRSLVQQGQTVEAIRRMREIADVSLHDARIMVEIIQQDEASEYSLQRLMEEAAFRSKKNTYLQVQPLSESDKRAVRTTAAAFGTGITCWVVALIVFILLVTLVPLLIALSSDNGPLAPLWSQVNPLGFAALDLTLGEQGIAPGMFNDPRAIAVDSQANIYVADYNTGRLQSLDSTGRSRWLVNLGDKTIVKSLDVSPTGVLWVAAEGDLRRFQIQDGKELEPFASPDGHNYMDDLNFAPDGRLAVIADGEDLLVFNGDSQLVLEIPAAVSSVTQDSELETDVAQDALGNLYLLGHFNNLVLKYSPQGRYISQFGGEAVDQTDGKFRALGDIAVDQLGRVYVSDIYGIQVFSDSGQYLDRFKLFQYAFGMDFDSQNNLYIASNEPHIFRLKIRK